MSLFDAVLLGFIQGVAEFLPISSKTHLFLTQHFLGLRDPKKNLFFVVLLHQANLAAILFYYGRAIFRSVVSARREVLWVALATVPAAAAGYCGKPFLEVLYAQPAWNFAGLLVTAAVLAAAHRRGAGGGNFRDLSWRGALGVGFAQAAALLPGISRSGMTVSTGLFSGLSAVEAVRFSFYLGGVAIAGAGLLGASEPLRGGISLACSWGVLLAGLAVTFVTSLAAIRAVERLVCAGRLWIFSAYCATVGAAGLAWLAL